MRTRHVHPNGFALPIAIFALVLLSTLIVGVLFVATEELRAGRSDVAEQRALARAEWAVERAISEWRGERNTGMTLGAVIPLTGATGARDEEVELTLTRTQPRSFWLVASAAVRDGRAVPARRIVGASLRLHSPPVPLDAALSVGGVVTVRDGGTVSGHDGPVLAPHERLCAAVPGTDAAGVLAPDSASVCDATCSGEVPGGVTGSPAVAVAPDAANDSASTPSGDALYATLVARATITVDGGAIAARPVVGPNGACDTATPTNWGDPRGAMPCVHHFPIVFARGSVVLTAGSLGQGILVVDGDLALEPGARFVGLAVATDDITVRGPDAELAGVAIARDRDKEGGTFVIDGGAVRFSRCSARVAALGASRLVRTPAWWWSELR